MVNGDIFINARDRKTYDAVGNRTSKTALQQADPTPVSVLSQYSYDPTYQLTQAVVGGSLAESYTYDAVGNRLTSLNPASYTYNSSNQLTLELRRDVYLRRERKHSDQDRLDRENLLHLGLRESADTSHAAGNGWNRQLAV